MKLKIFISVISQYFTFPQVSVILSTHECVLKICTHYICTYKLFVLHKNYSSLYHDYLIDSGHLKINLF